MRISQTPPALLSLLFTVLSHTTTVKAVPLVLELGFGFLHGRQNGNCGADLQYTCVAGEGCFTANNIAYCSATPAGNAGGSGGYAVYTTTYTETDLVLRTSTYTTSWAAATTPAVVWAPAPTSAAICSADLGQSQCGALCCASTQSCFMAGSCTDLPSSLWTYTAMPNPTVTSTYSAPVRPTSGGVSTATSVVSASTTMPFVPPATASGSTLPITGSSTSGGLSPGAIAGIVIGVIAGIIILLLICFCCCVKAGLSGLLAIFGLGKKKRRSTERIETVERYSRHGSGSRRDTHTGWFGASRPTRVDESRKKKSSGFGGLGAVGAGLAGLALILGLKRRHDRKEKAARSDIGSSYYTDSYTGTSESSASSDRRTRDSRRDRR